MSAWDVGDIEWPSHVVASQQFQGNEMPKS
jgi:hypothetical protein